MTLITYTSRVHFADGVLEEAIRSELEVNDKKRPFLLIEETDDDAYDHMLHRLLDGILHKRPIKTFSYSHDLPIESAIHTIASEYKASKSDILLALGSNTVIDVGKLARVAIAHNKPLSRFTIAEGGSRRIGEQALPDFYAIPSIHGFCSSISAHAKLVLENGSHQRMMCKRLVPTVSICDPTLTSDTSADVTVSTGVDTISRCLEAYLSPNYNPPADGIAFDGLRRAVEFLPKILQSEQLEYRREMMAASLNSALALQKGLGTTQVIGDSLQQVCDKYLDLGLVRRVLLPKVVSLAAQPNNVKLVSLSLLFNTTGDENFAQVIERFLETLPMSNSFSNLGITADRVSEAAEIASEAMLLAPGLDTLASQSIENMMTGIQ